MVLSCCVLQAWAGRSGHHVLSEVKEPPSSPAARQMHRPHNYADSAYFVHQRYEDTALVIFQQQAKKNKELKPSQYKPLSPLSPAAAQQQQQQEEEQQQQQQPQPQQQQSPSGKGHRSGKSSAGGFSSSGSKPAAGDHRSTGDGSSGPPRPPPGNGRGPPSPAPHLSDAPSSGQRAAGLGRRPGDVSPPPASGRPAAAAVVVEAGADGFASAPDKAANSGGDLSPRGVRPPPSGSPVNAYSSFSSSSSKTLPGHSGETPPGDENLLGFGGGSGSGAGTDSDSNLPPSGWTPRNVEVKNGSRRVPTTTTATTTSSQDVAVKGSRVDTDGGGGRVGKAVSGDGCPAGDGVSGSGSGVVEFGHYGSTGVVTRRRVAMTKLDSGRTQSRVCAVM